MAANTDKLKKYKSLFSTTLSTGIGTGTSDTITLASVTGLPTDTAITLTIDRVDSSGVATPNLLERITGVISGGNLTSYVRGVDGTTEQAHAGGAVIEMVWNADDLNDMVDWGLVGHNQDGTHKADGVVALLTGSQTFTGAKTFSTAPLFTFGTEASGDTFYGAADGTITRLAKGSDGQVLTLASGLPSWSSSSVTIPQGIYGQACVDGGCEVAQKTTTVNISTSYQYGQVDMYRAKATGTAVSAGTITQTSSATAGTTGYALKLAGVTLTGSGVVYANHLIDPPSARKYKNQTASFSVKVYHDVGSAIDYTVVIGKASTLNNFGTITTIATSSATSVANTTATTVTFNNISMGDCSNGISIEVSAACGAVTTKNFEFTEWQFNLGTTALAYVPQDFGDELGKIQRRFYKKSHNYATNPGTQEAASLIYHVLSDNVTNKLVRVTVGLPGVMAKTPTLSYWDNAATPNASKITTYNTAFVGTDNVSATSTAVTDNSFYVYYTGAVAGIGFSYTVDARPS